MFMGKLEGFLGVVRDRSPTTSRTGRAKIGEVRPNYPGEYEKSFKV